MPIEFRCTQCGKLLRTPEDTAGKRAKCPECGTVLTIPVPQVGLPGPQPPAGATVPGSPPPLPGESGGGVPPGGYAYQPASPFAPGRPPAGPPNPYQSPSPYPGQVPLADPGGVIRRTPLDFGDVFGRTWKIFARQWSSCVLVCFVALLLYGAGVVVWVALMAATNPTGKTPAGPVVVMLLGLPALMMFFIWLGIGQSLFFLKTARGQEATLHDLFTGGPHFWPVLGASILFMLIVSAGMLLCYVPGVIFMLMFSQYYYLILDRKVGVVESLELSKELTTGSKLMLFAIQLVAGVVMQVLFYATCGLGLLAAVPFMALLNAVVYLAMSGQPTADRAWPVPQPPPAGGPGPWA
jgi:hypothetical protein